MTGEEIRNLRNKLGLTQLQFAIELNVTLGTVSNWETKRVTPIQGAMEKLIALKRDYEKKHA